ncbi:hypothetical protein BKA70DRAFT_1560001 [Coprinopsis sp. MPI-PUGE-AT-0042]|nr:hypothetical protein BKA70DRAFT_1560001 [Coprinopsis sp. MPI-PUGE-AT-0042]
MSDPQQPGPLLLPVPRPIPPPPEPYILLERYSFAFTSDVRFTEQDRNDAAIVLYYHPMTYEVLCASIVKAFNVRAEVLGRWNVRLRKSDRGRDVWVKVEPEDWESFLRPNDVVGIFLGPDRFEA